MRIATTMTTRFDLNARRMDECGDDDCARARAIVVPAFIHPTRVQIKPRRHRRRDSHLVALAIARSPAARTDDGVLTPPSPLAGFSFAGDDMSRRAVPRGDRSAANGRI